MGLSQKYTTIILQQFEELKIHIKREVAVIPIEMMEIGVQNVSVRFQESIKFHLTDIYFKT